MPNERDNKGTVKVDLRLPDGFYFVSYKKVPGWTVKLTRQKLDTPVDFGGFSVSERFTRIVWTGNPKQGGIIRPDQFEEFPIAVRIPDGNPGDQLVFPAFQTYRGGERVAWTGAPDAEEPAPRLTLTAPVDEQLPSPLVDRGALPRRRPPRSRPAWRRERWPLGVRARGDPVRGGRRRGAGSDRFVTRDPDALTRVLIHPAPPRPQANRPGGRGRRAAT